VYAFSTENWKRSTEEVGGIMRLLGKYLEEALADMEKNHVCFRFFGDLSRLSPELQKLCLDAQERSSQYHEVQVNFCLNYGGRDEIVKASQAFAKDVANYVFENDVKDAEEVISAMADVTTEAIQKIGENIKIRRFAKYVSDEAIDSYIHMGGKIGVLVECKKGVSTETLHDVALQIAAAKPLYVNEAEVPASVIEKEKDILRAQIANDEKLANKPEMVKEKMVEGKVKKYYDENCVLNQAFIKDPSLTVAQLLAKEDSTVIRFTRFEMGEGLEKKSNDFAAEVAAQMKK
jgi:elongation factor Ts